jgi:PiT family inorganic phosphate transporter
MGKEELTMLAYIAFATVLFLIPAALVSDELAAVNIVRDSFHPDCRMLRKGEAVKGYRLGQIGSAALVSLAHGTNDAQKTMGVISLALIAHGDITAAHFYVPVWVKLGCALAIGLGTASGAGGSSTRWATG